MKKRTIRPLNGKRDNSHPQCKKGQFAPSVQKGTIRPLSAKRDNSPPQCKKGQFAPSVQKGTIRPLSAKRDNSPPLNPNCHFAWFRLSESLPHGIMSPPLCFWKK